MEQETKIMKDLLAQEKGIPQMPKAGDLIEGTIIKLGSNTIIVDLGPLGAGIIYGGEIKENKEIIRGLKIGQKISALVVDPENDDGYVELSLKEAHLEKTWGGLEEKRQKGEIVSVKVMEANRGGLVIKLDGVIGFLPVSQLSSANYPRVEGGDKNKILSHLNDFVGKEMKVKIIGLDKKSEKLIVSEKAIERKKIDESLKNFRTGDVVEGAVTALTDFGAFIKFADNLEGLAHISELSWQIIDHPSQVVKENEIIKTQIINIQDGQISLSLKALEENPWQDAKDKYQNGQIIKGKVVKFGSQGAFIQIDRGIHGLAHISEFSKNNQAIEEMLRIGESYDFKIVSLLPEERKISLTLANSIQ